MAEIINGKELARNIRAKLKDDVDELRQKGIVPKLAVVLVGDDKASKVYVKNKSKACAEIGVEFEEFILDQDTTMGKLLELIDELNKRDDIHGILVQAPLPAQIDTNKVFGNIDHKKDVDGFNPVNVGKLCLNQDCFVSCTPFGIIKMLEAYDVNMEGANAVIIGRSNIVGKPLIQCLLNKNATVTVCHSRTKNIADITKKADILLVAMGKPKFVKADMVKDGVVVIDVGINRTEEGLVGDVDFENVEKKASKITPVPGGVGPMTIAMLMNNVVKAAKNRLN